MWHFLILSVLNLLDGIFTFWGLSFNFITEANPLMDWLWMKSPWLFIGFKVFLSSSIIILAFHSKHLSNQRRWKIFLLLVNVLYSFILFLHFYWVGNLIFLSF
ncbi:MAG: DUF5658 family protein [Anaerobacillus sp.]|uniref:DUF5658 family protein n=1 Tax=Anaerobacillus sp. TaxID=1872506 RepID=UPI00391B3879